MSQDVAPEKLDYLRSLQGKWDALTKRYGELYFQKKLVDRELEAVDTALDNLEAERQESVKKLQDEFGSAGTINLQTGVFTPDQASS